jgi:hypothetical protein
MSLKGRPVAQGWGDFQDSQKKGFKKLLKKKNSLKSKIFKKVKKGGVRVIVRCREFIIMINSKCAANLS